MNLHLESTQQEIRLALQAKLVERCKCNPKYSLRSFSRTLQVEPSFLSKLLSGKRRFTPKTIQKLNERLASPLVPEIAPAATNFQPLAADAFLAISEWYHLAILELFLVHQFKVTAQSIARALEISQAESSSALERLARLQLIQKKRSSWELTSGNNSTLAQGSTSSSLRQLQRKILQQAIVALEECPAELRDQSTMTMAIDPNLLPQAKEKIKSFRRELCAFLQENRKNEEVYQLSVSFFPVSNLKKIQGVKK